MVEWQLGPWGSKKKKPIGKLESLTAKLYADGILEARLGMIFAMHLALEVGNLDVLDFVDAEIPEGRKKMLIKIKELSSSNKPLDRVTGLEYQLQIVDLVLRTASIPWMTAGEMGSPAKVLDGWEGLYARSKTAILSVRNIILRSEAGLIIQKKMDLTALLDNLQKTLIMKPFRYGRLISDLSYKAADVRPNQIAVFFEMGTQTKGGFERRRDTIFGDGSKNQNLREIVREEMRRSK